MKEPVSVPIYLDVQSNEEYDVQIENDADFSAELGNSIIINKVESGLPSGGDPGQLLVKNSYIDYDASWKSVNYLLYIDADISTSGDFWRISFPDKTVEQVYELIKSTCRLEILPVIKAMLDNDVNNVIYLPLTKFEESSSESQGSTYLLHGTEIFSSISEFLAYELVIEALRIGTDPFGRYLYSYTASISARQIPQASDRGTIYYEFIDNESSDAWFGNIRPIEPIDFDDISAQLDNSKAVFAKYASEEDIVLALTSYNGNEIVFSGIVNEDLCIIIRGYNTTWNISYNTYPIINEDDATIYMWGNRISNLGDAVDSGDAVNLGQVEEMISEIGSGLPSGGLQGDILWKTSNADNAVGWVTPASSVEQDNTRPITAAAVYTEIGNINALLATI